MDDLLRSAFAAVEAEETLKAKTRETLFKKTRGYSVSPSRRAYRVGWAVAAVCLLLFAGLSAGLFFTPVSAISVDINPSLELEVNRFDRVIAVKGCNQDGMELAQKLDLQFMEYGKAIEALLSNSHIQAYLEQGESLSIYVACDDQQRGDAMLSTVKSCTGQQRNVHCHGGGQVESTAAHAAGLSCGKYQAFLELQSLDPSITADDVQNMTMREIRERILALSGDVSKASGHHGHNHGGRH